MNFSTLNTRKMQEPTIWFVVDSTCSMTAFLRSLRESLAQVIGIIQLTRRIKIGLLEYRDHDYSSMYKVHAPTYDYKAITKIVHNLTPGNSGKDSPEAVKSAFHVLGRGTNHWSLNASSLVIHFTDATPHYRVAVSRHQYGSHPSNLIKDLSFTGDVVAVWSTLCKCIGRTGARVCTVTPRNDFWYPVMARFTNGICYVVNQNNATEITHRTMDIIFAAMACLEKVPTARVYISNDFFKRRRDAHIRTSMKEEEAFYRVRRLVDTAKKMDSIPAFHSNYQQIVTQFRTVDNYRETVFRVFEEIFDAGYIMSLTYNPVFGLVWREVCKMRCHPRRDTVVSKFNEVSAKISPADRVVFDEWLEESYNSIAEINAVIDKLPHTKLMPACIIETANEVGAVPMTRKDILEITRTCNKGTLANVTSLLTQIRIVGEDTETKLRDEIPYLPLALDDRDLFSMIPHLICPGTMFTFRASIIIAAICVKTENFLADRALSYLQKYRGKWFDQTFSENYSAGFSGLMHASYLTEKETVLFKLIDTFHKFKAVQGHVVTIKTGFTPEIDKIYPIRYITCQFCLRSTPESLFNAQKGKCVSCYSNEDYHKPKSEHRMAECKTCHVHYALMDPDNLNVAPKCYACRYGDTSADIRTCVQCHNRVITCPYNALCGMDIYTEPFLCYPCEQKADTVHEEEVKIKDLPIGFILTHIPAMQRLAPIKYAIINGIEHITPYKLANDFWKIAQTELSSKEKVDIPMWNGKLIINVDDVIKQTSQLIEKGDPAFYDCALCYDRCHESKITPACGKCRNVICTECASNWYGQIQLGKVVLITHLSCMFCKQRPTANIMKRFNKYACHVQGKKMTDPNFYYAWCMVCYQIAPAIERTCAQDEIPNIDKFMCEGCKMIGNCNDAPETKECPRCGITTERTSGCNHITCPARYKGRTCGCHWCYVCGKAFTANTIYDHLFDDHGGLFTT